MKTAWFPAFSLWPGRMRRLLGIPLPAVVSLLQLPAPIEVGEAL